MARDVSYSGVRYGALWAVTKPDRVCCSGQEFGSEIISASIYFRVEPVGLKSSGPRF